MSIDDLLKANQAHVAAAKPASADGPMELAILTCMDARIDPWSAFGLKPGQAHVIRNAGGRLSDDAVRSLVISQELLGSSAVMIVHHSDCGMLRFTNDSLRQRLAAQGRDAAGVEFLPFTDLTQSVRDDLELYRQHPLLRQDIPLRGFVFDVSSHALQEVS